MRFRIAIAFLLLAAAAAATPAEAREAPRPKGWVLGDFEVSGYLSAGAGWQRFSDAPVTEWANDGSFAGVLGSVIPNATNGTLPSPKQDNAMAFVEVAELDLARSIGDRARLRADIWLGRPDSGSWVPLGIELEQGYAVVTLSRKHAVEFMLGRFVTEAGFEEDLPYDNDAISWSVLSRSNLYPYHATGAQVVWGIAEGVDLYVASSNSIINDWDLKTNDMPGFFATLSLEWGEEARGNWFTVTPFLGPESNSNRHYTYGADAAAGIWATPSFQIGLEGLFHRDNGYGGPSTNYAAGLANLHYDFSGRWYGFARYAYAQQFEAGNGVLNLTGAKQQIHEMSLGGGVLIAEGMKLKLEARTDAVAPDGGATQWTPGAAMALVCAF